MAPTHDPDTERCHYQLKAIEEKCMTEKTNATAQFEELVADILRRNGCKDVVTNIDYPGSLDHSYEIDILFGDAENATVVEVKRYRFLSPPAPDLFLSALHQVRAIQEETRVKNSMLVMSCPMSPALAAITRQYPEIEIWDAQKLYDQASRFPDLVKRLEILLEVSVSEILRGLPQTAAESQRAAKLSKGEELARSLEAILPGRESAYVFEDKCVEALKYLFDRDLVGWHEQHDTEDGLQRRDLVCRILPRSEVWQLMLTDLRSRYVIFEFKNYSEPISQREIVTTERYLYPLALRKLAIIISPHGCSPSASRVIQGAMREHGKLILPLTVSEVATLLLGKDQGSDPNAFLFDRVDDFLMSLGR